jgi:hypothetical protein|tara:strand:+ start:2526 stop:2843 length:318 start_codon:yes stop_codon:yes gene_type:complete
MANTFKNYPASNVSSNTVVYTTPASTSATLIGMTIANKTASSVLANIHMNIGGTNFHMIKDATIPTGGALVPIGNDQKVVMEATDTLSVSCSGNCDVILSALEIT